MWINILLVLIYLITVLIIGWISGKRETPQDFIIASRNVGLFRTSASIFAVLGGETLIFQSALAYNLGFSAFWFWGGIALGMILFGLCVPKIKTLGDKYQFVNITEYFGLKWGYPNRLLSAVIIFVAFFTLIAVQLMAVGNIIGPLFNISYSVIIAVSSLVVLTYLLLGGYKAVINTDLLQAIIMFVLMLLVTGFMNLGEWNFSQNISSGDTVTLVSFILIGIFFIFASADIWQRIFSARSIKVAKNSFFLVAVLFLIFGLAVTLIGIGAHNAFPNIDPNQAFYFGLSTLIPSWLLGLSIIMVLATIMSTIDTEVYLLSSSIVRDFIGYKREVLGEIEQSKFIKITMIVLMILATLIALLVKDIILVLFALASFSLSIAPPLIASIFWKLKPKAVFLSLSGGILAFLVLIIIGKFNQDTAVITLPASIVFLIIGQTFFKDKELTTNI